MVKAHFVKKARKSRAAAGIRKGDSYWHWKFFRQPKQYSRTAPRRSQLTRSPFLSALYAIEEGISRDGQPSVADDLRAAASSIMALEEEQREKLDAMEASGKFPNGCPTMELLQARIEACERIAGELQQAIYEVETVVFPDDYENREALEQAEDLVRSAVEAVDWSCE